MYTNINIKENDRVFNYIIGYQTDGIIEDTNISYTINGDNISFWDDNIGYNKYNNQWIADTSSPKDDWLPNIIKQSLITLYFPCYSLDTYHDNIKYALNCSLMVGNKILSLGSVILNRKDSLACDRVSTFMNQKYYEKIDVEIIDPYDLVYSDSWKDFRNKICGEALINKNSMNNGASILYFTLHSVVEGDNGYIKMDGCTGGQNSIQLSKKLSDQIHLNISTNTTKKLENKTRPSFLLEIITNDYFSSLDEYLLETYGLEDYNLYYELIIGNDSDIYVKLNNQDPTKSSSYSFQKKDIIEKNFQNGKGWVPGIFVIGSVSITNKDDEEILYILSNKIPFNEEIFKYFVAGDFSIDGKTPINYINLDSVNMNVLDIKVANKIVNNVIQTTSNIDAKSNIIQPVFFKIMDSADINLYPEVTSTICINLDYYKSKVTSFIIQVEGIKFPEIGRTNSGVLFKITGKRLPNIKQSGQYYILDQNSELVTTGKYNYL